MRINISNTEMLLCRTFGVLRRSAAANNVTDRQMGKQDVWGIDIDGMVGEYCVARYLNVFPDFTVGIRSGGADLISKDGNTIDVKSTRYKNGCLLATLKKEKDPCDIYILVIVDDSGVDIAGWVKSEDLFKDNNKKDHGHGIGYSLTQDQLNKFKRN